MDKLGNDARSLNIQPLDSVGVLKYPIISKTRNRGIYLFSSRAQNLCPIQGHPQRDITLFLGE